MKYKMTFVVTEEFEGLIDEETFRDEYDNDLLRLCREMYNEEGTGFISNELKLISAEFTQ